MACTCRHSPYVHVCRWHGVWQARAAGAPCSSSTRHRWHAGCVPWPRCWGTVWRPAAAAVQQPRRAAGEDANGVQNSTGCTLYAGSAQVALHVAGEACWVDLSHKQRYSSKAQQRACAGCTNTHGSGACESYRNTPAAWPAQSGRGDAGGAGRAATASEGHAHPAMYGTNAVLWRAVLLCWNLQGRGGGAAGGWQEAGGVNSLLSSSSWHNNSH